MRNKLFKVTSIAAIFAVASANVYIMNDVDLNSNSDLSLLTLENVAEADENDQGEWGRTSEQVHKKDKEQAYSIKCGTCGYDGVVCKKGSNNCQPHVCSHIRQLFN